MTKLNADVQNWVDISAYDLCTARSMLRARRYLYVLFMCQQAMEKLLKALVVQKTSEFPPRTHNLMQLKDMLSINLDEDTEGFLARLPEYYIETRYPENLRKLSKEVTRGLAKTYYRRTKKLWQELYKRLN